MLMLPIEARIELDDGLGAVQTERTETPLVREFLLRAPAVIRHVVEPYARVQACDVVVGSLLCHGSPKVTWEHGRPPAGLGPELGDLLVVTAFVHRGSLASTRARLFQAKTRATHIDEDQYWLYRYWPPFEIYSPRATGYTWFLSPEAYGFPPGYEWRPAASQRGTSYLWVEQGASPVTTHVANREASGQKDPALRLQDSAPLGWFLCDMLSDSAGREFAVSAPDLSSWNGWDELVTYLLLRADQQDATTCWALPELPAGIATGKPRPYSSTFIHSFAHEPQQHVGRAVVSHAGGAGDRALAWVDDGGGVEGNELESDGDPTGGALAIIIASRDGGAE